MKQAFYLVAAISILLLSACLEMPTLPVSTPAGTATATAQPTMTADPTSTPRPTALVVADVLQVRDATGVVRHWLKLDDVVTVLGCKDKLCKISTDVLTGYVWQGCLTFNPDSIGCEAK